MNELPAKNPVSPGTGETKIYAGDVDARRAWEILREDPKAVLVDVRTLPEWQFVGVPVLDELDKKTVFVSWQHYGAKESNAEFENEISAAGVTKDATVLFVCRSGARSRAAAIAMTAAGYTTCYNVSGGFEGPLDADRHRGSADGWKALNLPWGQE